jgi:hypothetical protein
MIMKNNKKIVIFHCFVCFLSDINFIGIIIALYKNIENITESKTNEKVGSDWKWHGRNAYD